MNKLFSEIKIRNCTIKNRIVMPPMVCSGYVKEDGFITANNIQHYEARAKGGTGLIIIEATCVNNRGRLADYQLGLWSDAHIEGFSRIAETCHHFGAKVLVQLHHAGLKTPKSVSNDPVAPSNYHETDANSGKNFSARALTIDEIHDLQGDFVAAAIRAKKAGLDGIELHGAHGYLISQFLSPLVNKRLDAYGGNILNRTRFATEIIAGIRETAGEDFIIGCRMGGNEPDLTNSIEIAQKLENAGADLLHVSFGMIAPLEMAAENESPAVPKDFNYHWVVYNGTQIKRKVNLPVIVVFLIKTPEQANYLIENGWANLTAIGRGLLVDPDWANKARQNQNIINCLSCKTCAWFKSSANCPRNQG